MMRAILLLLLMTHAALAQTVWRAATEYPASAMPGEGLATFARLVAERSGGQVLVQPRYDAPDGLKSAAIPGAVQAGTIEVGDAFAGALAGLDPSFQLSSLPFLATSTEQALRLYAAARPLYVKAFVARGQRLVYVTPWPPTGIWSRAAITGPASLQGLALRTYDRTSTQVMQAAGAAAVELSFADAMPRLRDGSVVAVLSSGDGGAGRRLWEFAPHFLAIGYAMPLSFTTVSAKAYDALTEAQRAAVDAAGAETEALQWAALGRRVEANYAVMRANGVSIETPGAATAEALARAGAGVTRDWAAGAGAEAAGVLAVYGR